MSPPDVGLCVVRALRGRAVWVIPLLLFVAILLAAGLAFNLANLDTGGERVPGPANSGTTASSPWGLFDPQTAAFLLVATFAGLVAIFILVILLRRKGTAYRRPVRPTTWADVVATILAFGMFLALLFLWPQIVTAVSRPVPPTNGTVNGTGNVTVLPAPGGIPLGVFLAGAVLVSLVAMALFVRVGLKLGRPGPEAGLPQRRIGAAHVVQAAISELQLGGDVRTVILACYERFCYFLGARGVSYQETLTPREIEDLAVNRLAVSQDSAESLTSLFEEARYSEHTLGHTDRDRAVQSLERIRADLEV
jgi:hypothetical protein